MTAIRSPSTPSARHLSCTTLILLALCASPLAAQEPQPLPENASAKRYGGGWTCDAGYREDGDLVVSADNFAYNFAGTAFIAYLSGLTNTAYTATQYALFSSLFSLPGKLLMGASGWVVDSTGYFVFFLYTSALGLPSLFLLIWLTRRLPSRAATA